MNRFHKIILGLVLLVVVLGANLQAETATRPEAPAKPAVAEKPLVTSYAPTLLFLGPIPANAPEEERNVATVFANQWPKNFPSIPITNSILFTWAVALVIIAVVRFGTRNMKEVPSGAQNFVEALVGGLKDMCEGMLEPKVARWVFPIASAFFIFIATANLMGLFPGIGSIGWGEKAHAGESLSWMPFAIHHTESPVFRTPTADANMTVSMAAIFFIMSIFWSLRYNGPFGVVKHIFGVKGGFKGMIVLPLGLIFFVVGLFEIISICVRPVALAMRLYGNIYGGENVLDVMLTGSPLGIAAVPFYFLELLVALVQALVFCVLTIAFVNIDCSHEGDEGEHAH